MQDNEIRTKVLSDWKPETNIRLQKVFGKFVEEVGELLTTLEGLDKYLVSTHKDVEDELADVDAVITMIEVASDGQINYDSYLLKSDLGRNIEKIKKSDSSRLSLATAIGRCCVIVGRCQIQGLKGKDPNSFVPNIWVLIGALINLRFFMQAFSVDMQFDLDRMEKRKQAKIDTKLPWVMGTATNLIPDV